MIFVTIIKMQCAICGSDRLKPVKNHEKYTLEDCAACGAQFWFPLVHPGEKYYETPVFRRGRLQWRQKQFLNHPPIKEGRLLDIGCGLGNFLEAVHKKFPDIEPWGIDIAQNHVDFIRENCGIEHVYAADLRDFLKRADLPKFDAVTMFEIIEHAESPNELLSDVKNILNPGGYVVVSTPNLYRLGGPFRGEDLPPHHFWRWRPKTLRTTLERNGFKVTRFIEEPLGKDFVWRSLHRLEWFNRLKGAVVNWSAPKTEQLIAAQRAHHQKIDAGRLKRGDFFVLAKDIVSSIIAAPISLIGRIFGWKYWDMYIEARKAF
jgi:SAM-dependent methyltransferase